MQSSETLRNSLGLNYKSATVAPAPWICLGKNGIPLLKELVPRLPDGLGILNQVADPNAVHADTYGAHFSEGTAKGWTIG